MRLRLAIIGDPRGKTSGGNDGPFRGNLFVVLGKNKPTAAFSSSPNRSRLAAGKYFRTALVRCVQNGPRQRAVVNRRFLRPQHCRFDVGIQRRLKLACVVGANRLGL